MLLLRRQQAASARHRAHACVWYALLLLCAEVANCQLSTPVASDKHWADQAPDNKFLQRTAENDKDDSQ